MRKLPLFLIMVFSLTLFFGCKEEKPKVLEKKVTPDKLTKIAKEITEKKELSREDVDLYANGLTRLLVAKDTLSGKTVSDIIDYEKEQRRLISYNALLTSSTRAQMELCLTFKSDQLAPKKAKNDQIYDILIFTVKNISKRTITEFNGMLFFQTANGKVLKRFDISYDQPIAAGETKNLQQAFKIDKNSNNVYAAKKQNIKMSTRWQAMKISFDDGETLELKAVKRNQK